MQQGGVLTGTVQAEQLLALRFLKSTLRWLEGTRHSTRTAHLGWGDVLTVGLGMLLPCGESMSVLSGSSRCCQCSRHMFKVCVRKGSAYSGTRIRRTRQVCVSKALNDILCSTAVLADCACNVLCVVHIGSMSKSQPMYVESGAAHGLSKYAWLLHEGGDLRQIVPVTGIRQAWMRFAEPLYHIRQSAVKCLVPGELLVCSGSVVEVAIGLVLLLLHLVSATSYRDLASAVRFS